MYLYILLAELIILENVLYSNQKMSEFSVSTSFVRNRFIIKPYLTRNSIVNQTI